MRHLGDITKINGASAPPVNVIIGGSPCQDLSIAGKRAGLAGQRSGLFMEQLRIIKEMRKADADRGRTGKDIRPRYMVWENVPGAFSSNKGTDFGAVLQETVKVIDGQAPAVPMPIKGWPLAGCLYGDGGFSISWRVFDAQFWGVPQRRRRIALVADFGGLTAPEILFERESVSGDSTESGTAWQAAAGSTEDRAYPTVNGVVGTLDSNYGKGPGMRGGVERTICIQGNCIDRADTAGCNGRGWTEDVSYTLNTIDRPAVLSVDPVSFTNRGADGHGATETLRAQSHGAIPLVAENHALNPWDSQSAHIYPDNGVRHSLNANEGGGQSCDTVLTDCYPDVAHTLTQCYDGSPQPDKGNGANIIAFTQNQRDEVWDLHNKSGGLSAEPGGKQQTYLAEPIVLESNQNHATITQSGVTPTLPASMGLGGGYVPMISCYAIGNGQVDDTGVHKVCGTLNCMHDQQAVMLFENHGQDSRIKGPLDVSPTVSQKYGTGGNNTPLVASPCCGVTSGQQFTGKFSEIAETLRSRDYKEPQAVCAAIDCRNATEGDINGTMQAKASGGFSYNCNQFVRTGYAVRRLTPLECERLQGFPDGWTDIGDWRENKGKSHKVSDANRYKALGNSIAIPSWFYVLQRLSVCCIDTTMASLFDGIGGFPFIWETLHGKGSCLWASEIEEFPIAVTRLHFPEQ